MPKTTDRDALARQIADLIRQHGYDGTSLSLISQATGLRKGSLYHHFPKGKEDIAEAAMTAIAREVDAQAMALLRGPGSPRARLDAWAQAIDCFYGGGKASCLLGSMVLSGGLGPFPQALGAAFGTLIEGLATFLEDAGLPATEAQDRARTAVERIQGALVVGRALDDRSGFKQLMAVLPRDLLAGIDGDPETFDALTH